MNHSEITADDFRRELLRQLMPTGLPGRYGVDSELERNVRRLIGIIDSMTRGERLHAGQITDRSRRRRIARGAGVTLGEVDEFVKHCAGLNEMMRRMRGMRG